MSKDFDPYEANRPPREEGWAEETEEIFDKIQNRGDQRIGQYLINVIRNTDKYEYVKRKTGYDDKQAVEQILWNIEAKELLEAIIKREKEREKR